MARLVFETCCHQGLGDHLAQLAFEERQAIAQCLTGTTAPRSASCCLPACIRTQKARNLIHSGRSLGETAAITAAATYGPTASRRHPRTLLAANAEVLVPRTEAAGVADAMLKA